MGRIELDRRSFLRVTGEAAVLAGGATVLASCSKGGTSQGALSSADSSPGHLTGTPSSGAAGAGAAPQLGATAPTSVAGVPSTAAGAGATKLPGYVALTLVKPDLPALPDGVDPGFFRLPSDPVDLHNGAVAGGTTVTALTSGISVPPPAESKSRFWQELNKRLDGNLKVVVPGVASDYTSKLMTMIAGGDLPDFVQIMPSPFLGILPPPNLPEVLNAKFQDLTDYVVGDAIKDYPCLANVPTLSWKNTVINGRIYGVPIPKGATGNAMMIREDVRKSLGAPDQINSGDEFIQLCRTLTDEKKNRWAAGVAVPLIQFFQEMLGAPNGWSVDGGKFTSAYESAETKQAISLVKQMWSEGLIYPDAFAGGPSGYKLIGTNKVCLNYAWYAQWTAAIRDYRPADPSFDLSAIPTPSYHGGGLARHYLDPGIQSITAMKKSSDSRVRQLLRVANWFASPFGTAQHRFLSYGIEGWDYKMVDGAPLQTATGTSEITSMALSKIGSPPYGIYQAGSTQEDVTKIYDYEKAVLPNGVADPSIGLTSNTLLNKGASLIKALTSLEGDIIQGRKPLTAWDDGVRTWRQQGGDVIRSEYEKSYEAQS